MFEVPTRPVGRSDGKYYWWIRSSSFLPDGSWEFTLQVTNVPTVEKNELVLLRGLF